jgi:hypothetical protein
LFIFKTTVCSQLQQLEETRTVEMEDVEQVTAEFTQRLSESEKLCQQAIRVSYNILQDSLHIDCKV